MWTARGWVAIEHIRVGDWVWTRSESSPFEPVRLGQVGIVVRRSAPILEVRFDGGRVLRTTSEHPFWAAARGWTSAGELSAGDVLAGREGEWTTVAEVAPTATYEAVYNFHVPGDQTYFVGGTDWPAAVWAHNTGSLNGIDCLNADLSALGTVPDRGGLSAAGRSLSKHASGKRSGSSAFPDPKGNPGQINAQAQKVLDDILNDPASTIKQRAGKAGEQILQINRPDGSGVIFKWNGKQWQFSHFAENLF